MHKTQSSMTTQKRLARLFQYTGEQELSLEHSRQNLCKAQAFEPYASFQRLDRLSKGYLTTRDLLNYLKDNGTDTADEIDAQLVIKYFDGTGEGRLFYTEAACTQRPTYPIGQTEYLPFDVERLLAKLIQKEMKLARESERLKEELASRYDYNLERLFKDVDDINYNYVDAANLKRFLIKSGIFPNDALLISILRRFDLDADAKLNKKEFIEGVAPQIQDFSKRQTKENKALSKSGSSNRLFSPGKSFRQSQNAYSNNKSFRSSSRNREDEKATIADLKSPVSKLGRSSHKQKKSIKKSSAKENQASQIKDKSLIKSEKRVQDYELKREMLASPSQQVLRGQESNRDNSPLRMKYLSSQNQLLSSNIDLQKSYLKSPSHIKNDSFHNKSRLNESQHYQSQQKQREDQDTEGSLIYLIRNCFKEIIAIEAGLESIKKELALRSDFTLAGAFNLFTAYSQTRLSADDILQGLDKIGVVCDLHDVKLFVERYDADRDQRLGFWEFSNSLLPIETLIRDDLERRRSSFDMSYETKEVLRRTFRKIIDAESMMENLRQRVSREKSISVRKAFDGLDWLGRGFLTSNEFKRAFEQQGQQISNSSMHQSSILKHDGIDLESMIRRFNKDKLNGRVSLPEFVEELTPKNTQKVY